MCWIAGVGLSGWRRLVELKSAGGDAGGDSSNDRGDCGDERGNCWFLYNICALNFSVRLMH
jgi:hypothetical protein